jgi:hypothetical protein
MQILLRFVRLNENLYLYLNESRKKKELAKNEYKYLCKYVPNSIKERIEN